MIQNSLERLFKGMEETLSEIISPLLDDSFAQSQVSAMIEILRNLSTRVQWRVDQQVGLITKIREIVEASLKAEIGTKEELEGLRSMIKRSLPDLVDHKGLVECKRAYLKTLADVQKYLTLVPEAEEKEIRSLIHKFIVWHLDQELACLRTGMYKTMPKGE